MRMEVFPTPESPTIKYLSLSWVFYFIYYYYEIKSTILNGVEWSIEISSANSKSCSNWCSHSFSRIMIIYDVLQPEILVIYLLILIFIFSVKRSD